MAKTLPKPIDGTLRKFSLRVPEVIRECSGIVVFGKRIKSLVFSTDVAIIRNVNADAVIAVYPFTPQPIITQAILSASDIPVLVGVGGGLTSSTRVLNLSTNAEMQGALGVVLNAPISNDIVKSVSESIDIPTVVTVVRDDENIKARIEAGASILNVSAASRTPEIIRKIRKDFKDIPIIATGGPTDETIKKTIEAGANAITWTPPSNGDIFRSVMDAYRNGQPHP
ncbi:MAG: hydrolase [Acutalibacteraceae bacterium]